MIKNLLIGIFVVLTVTFGCLFYIETTKAPKVKVVTKKVIKEVEKKEVTPTDEEKALKGFYFGKYETDGIETKASIYLYDNNKFVYSYASSQSGNQYYTGTYSVKDKVLTLKIEWLLTEQFGEALPDFTFKIEDGAFLSEKDNNLYIRKATENEDTIINMSQNILPNQTMNK